MKVKCLKCVKIKELSSEELQEVGEFVLDRRLRAVHFLKYLSMDRRDLCTDGREHEWEFEESFDKEVHQISAHHSEAEKIKVDKTNEASECAKIIQEYENKRNVAIKVIEESSDKMMHDKIRLKEMVYVDDPGLWLEKE